MRDLNEKELAFIKDLSQVLSKHGARLDEWRDYDGEDCYVGSKFEFKADGIRLNIEDVVDAL